MRAGVFSRLCGWVVVAVEAALFALPFSVVQVTISLAYKNRFCRLH